MCSPRPTPRSASLDSLRQRLSDRRERARRGQRRNCRPATTTGGSGAGNRRSPDPTGRASGKSSPTWMGDIASRREELAGLEADAETVRQEIAGTREEAAQLAQRTEESAPGCPSLGTPARRASRGRAQRRARCPAGPGTRQPRPNSRFASSPSSAIVSAARSAPCKPDWTHCRVPSHGRRATGRRSKACGAELDEARAALASTRDEAAAAASRRDGPGGGNRDSRRPARRPVIDRRRSRRSSTGAPRCRGGTGDGAGRSRRGPPGIERRARGTGSHRARAGPTSGTPSPRWNPGGIAWRRPSPRWRRGRRAWRRWRRSSKRPARPWPIRKSVATPRGWRCNASRRSATRSSPTPRAPGRPSPDTRNGSPTCRTGSRPRTPGRRLSMTGSPTFAIRRRR